MDRHGSDAVSSDWFVYVVRCSDGSLYTGVAVDVDARVETHNAGKGARYTRGRGPVRIVASRGPMPRGDAQRLEARIKRVRGRRRKLAVLDESTVG
jgi:putative endonuclease